jgi:hypothetical protein
MSFGMTMFFVGPSKLLMNPAVIRLKK